MKWTIYLTFTLSYISSVCCQATMKTQPQNEAVAKGSAIVLRCRVENLALSQLSWFFVEHNMHISTGTTVLVRSEDKYSFVTPADTSTAVLNLQIKDVQASDAGHYRCYVNGSNVSVVHRLTVIGAPSAPNVITNPANVSACCKQQNVSSTCMDVCVPSKVNISAFDPLIACATDLDKLLKCFADSRNHAGCCRRRSLPDICVQFCSDKPPPLTLDHHVCLNTTTQIIECFEEGQMVLPGPPVEVSVLILPVDTIQVNWKAPAINPGGVTGYRVSYKLRTAKAYLTTSLISATTLQYSVLGVQTNSEYELYVTAIGQHGSSLPSETHIVKTISAPPVPGRGYDIAACCKSRKVSSNCQNKLCSSSTWRYMNPDAISLCYTQLDDIFHCLAGGRNHTPCCQSHAVQESCLQLCSGSPPPLTFALIKCLPQMPIIEACVSQGMSTLPSSPEMLTVQTVGSMTAELSWSPPQSASTVITVKSYLIQIKEIGADADFRNLEEVTAPYIRLDNLKPSTQYAVRVVTLGDTASSLPSETVVFLTYDGVLSSPAPTTATAKLHNITACCIESGVPPECQSICTYDITSLNSFAAINVVTCQPYLKKMLVCGSDGRNHVGCCKQRYVQESCLMFCDYTENSPTVDMSHLVCLLKLSDIVQCYREGLLSLPKHPVQVTVLNTTAHIIDVSWERPSTGPPIDYFILSYSPDLLNWTTKHLTTTRYIIQNLDSQVEYTIQVQSVNSNGTSPPSNRIDVSTKPGDVPTQPDTNGTVVDGRVIWANRSECCKNHNISAECIGICNSSQQPPPQCADQVHITLACLSDGRDHRPCCHRSGVPTSCLPFCHGHVTGNNFVSAACLTYFYAISNCSFEGTSVVPSEPRKLTVDLFKGNVVKVSWKAPLQNCASQKCSYSILYWRVSEDGKQLDGPEASSFEGVESPHDITTLQLTTHYMITVVAQNQYGGGQQAPAQIVFSEDTGALDVSIAQSPEGVINKGTAVKFICDVISSDTPTISWWKGSKKLGDTNKITFMEVKKEDEGTYTCKASTGDFEGQANVILPVRYIPEVSYHKDVRVSANKERTGILACWFKGHPDITTVKWMKDGKVYRAVPPKAKQYTELRSHTYTVAAQLRIYKVVPEDYGTYTCSVANKFGSATGAVRLIDADAPSPTEKPADRPANVTECCKQKNVSDICMVACSFDVEIKKLQQKPELFHCINYLPAYVGCAADGSDHSPCCKSKNVADFCLPFCAGNVPKVIGSGSSLLQCVLQADTILDCIEKNRDYIPSAPQSVNAIFEEQQIVVSWKKPARNGDKVERYLVYMKAAGIPQQKYSASDDVFTFPIHGVLPHLTYQVWVVASNSYGQSLNSEVKTVSTGGAKPNPPENLFVDSISSTSVVLKWSPPSRGLPPDGYIIYYKKNNDIKFSKVELSTIFTYTLQKLRTKYLYEAHVVSKSSDGGLSVQSNNVNFSPTDGVVTTGDKGKQSGIPSATKIGLGVGLTLLIVAIILVVILIFFVKLRRGKAPMSNESVSFENPSYGRNQVQIGGLARDVMQPSSQFSYGRLQEDGVISEKKDLSQDNQESQPEMNGNNPATLPVTTDDVHTYSNVTESTS